MKIHIKTTANDQVEVRYDEVPDLDKALAMLLTAVDASVKQVLPQLDEEDKSACYDYVIGLLDRMLANLFPDYTAESEFDMTDAAIVYAQDQIINEAFEKGITLEEALKLYEDKAQEYIAKRRAKES